MIPFCMALALASFWVSGSCMAMCAFGIKTKKGRVSAAPALTWAFIGLCFVGYAAGVV